MDQVQLSRECKAVQVPAGNETTLAEGLEVTIVQALGGTFTVQVPALGGLFRIAGGDADALGKEVPEEAKIESPEDAELEDKVWAALRTCFDPEIPVNIVDLGLIYDLQIRPHESGGHCVLVQMTLTAQGCGMGAAIAADARLKISSLPEVAAAEVAVVWDPPWGPQMMTDTARRALGI